MWSESCETSVTGLWQISVAFGATEPHLLLNKVVKAVIS